MAVRGLAECFQDGKCFAKTQIPGRKGFFCGVLQSTYRPGRKCPFQKLERDITNGVRYGYNPPAPQGKDDECEVM